MANGQSADQGIGYQPSDGPPEKLLALDARVVHSDKDIKRNNYPSWPSVPIPFSTWEHGRPKTKLKETIQPILAEDEALLVKFHTLLANRTVFMRCLHPLMLQERVMHERLARIRHCDYDREIALLAETTNVAGEQDLMGEVRLSKLHGTNEARLSILIGDPYQGIGLGSEMVRRL